MSSTRDGPSQRKRLHIPPIPEGRTAVELGKMLWGCDGSSHGIQSEAVLAHL